VRRTGHAQQADITQDNRWRRRESKTRRASAETYLRDATLLRTSPRSFDNFAPVASLLVPSHTTSNRRFMASRWQRNPARRSFGQVQQFRETQITLPLRMMK
jgi:hypothetical protein